MLQHGIFASSDEFCVNVPGQGMGESHQIILEKKRFRLL